MRERLRDRIGSRGALVLVIGVLLALAWAIPSIGASAGKVARTALARANQAFHNANLAQSTSNTAKSTANSANATAGAANNTASAANSTANSAQATANTALSVANGAVHRQSNFTQTVDAGNIQAGSCAGTNLSRFGVLSTDEVIMTAPSTQTSGIVSQAYTSTNQVTLVLCNITSSSIDPPSGSYEFSVLR